MAVVAKFLVSPNLKSILKPNLSVRANLLYTDCLETHCTMLIMSGLNSGGVFVLLFDLLLKISLGRKTIKYVLHY